MSTRRLFWILAATVLIVVCIRPAGAGRDNIYSNYRQCFVPIVNKVVENYVDEVDRKKLFEGACNGMLATLDPYCQFIGPDVLKEFNDNTQGEFGGLGIEIDMRGGILTVITPIKGTPAFKAGVMAGDMILEIQDEKDKKPTSTEGMTIHQAVKLLRGPVGTKVTITVIHEGRRKREKIAIKRDRIRIPTVESKMVDKKAKIGYVHIKSFTRPTAARAREAINQLKAQDMKGLILDLRNDPGGLFPSAIDVANMFLSKGVIVRTRGRGGELIKEEKATSETVGDFPLVVLINKQSASASEIVAGAIKDNRRGILVGETTYGKATVQSLIAINLGVEDGKRVEGALKLTTARYYTPDDVSINKKGISPDFEVKMTIEQQIALLRQQRREFLQKQERAESGEPEPPEDEQPKDDQDDEDEDDKTPVYEDTSSKAQIKNILNNLDRGRLSVRQALPKILAVVAGSAEEEIESIAPAEKVTDIQLERGIDILKVYDLVLAQLQANSK